MLNAKILEINLQEMLENVTDASQGSITMMRKAYILIKTIRTIENSQQYFGTSCLAASKEIENTINLD